MAGFLKGQIDYIFFIYGLSFIIAAAMCYMLKQLKFQTLPWQKLLYFTILHGINEWLDLTAISFGDHPAFNIARTSLMLISFIFLFEFGRSSVKMNSGRAPGLWFHAPLLLLTLAGAASGPEKFHIAVRYGYGFFGSIASALGFFYFFKNCADKNADYLKPSFYAFLVYAIACGTIVPAADFFPASIINYDNFLNFFHFPVQILRALAAITLAISLYNYFQASNGDTRERKKIRPAYKNVEIITLTAVLIAGWILIGLIDNAIYRQLHSKNTFNAELLSIHFMNEIDKSDFFIKTFDGTISKFVKTDNFIESKHLGTINAQLDIYALAIPKAIFYVMDTEGVTIASSNRSGPDSFLGANYAFRPYFINAMKGETSRYYAWGTTTQKRGYYISAPVRNGGGNIIGVAAVKIDIEDIKTEFFKYRHSFLLTPDGIIFHSSIPDLNFSCVNPIDIEKQKAIINSKQFPAINFNPVFHETPVSGQTISFLGEKYDVTIKYINNEKWSVMILSPLSSINHYRFLTIVLICVICIFLINFFVWSQIIKNSAHILAAEKERLMVTIRSIGDGVIAVDENLKIVMINNVAEKITGYCISEAVGKHIDEIFKAVEEKTGVRIENIAWAAIKTGSIINLLDDAMIKSRDGIETVISITGSPIIDKNDRIIGAIIVFNDITEKKKLNDELLKLSKVESLGLIAGGIAHDFNNVLAGIVASISMAKTMIAGNSRVIETLEQAENASLRAKHLTTQFITFSKGGKPIKKAVDLGELVKTTTLFMLTGSNAKCEFDIADGIRPVEIDGEQISQVITNMTLNAVQAMPNGGLITISIRNVEISADNGLHLKEGNFVVIKIADTGVGMTKEQLSRIFEPYFTTKSIGTGLGLTSAESIIRKHDGSITVNSSPGAGTTFQIYLPAAKKQADNVESTIKKRPENDPKSESVKDAKATKISKGRILIMDDETIIRDNITMLLNNTGFEAYSAKDGGETLEIYKKFREAGADLDVVVMDLTIPGGLGGIETIAKLLEIDPTVRAIASSGYFDGPVAADYKKFGFIDFIAKPYKIKELVKTLEKIISEKSTGDQ
ncbi:MAG TPA: ATP-binding protein [Candidatus Wallbacteria bacterium]|nr:ATP-binding protein [Candidatus Wallbacteria bacterium]